MRVLWFASSVLNPQLGKHGYNGGGWVDALQQELKSKGITMALACYGDDIDCKKLRHNGYEYYFINRAKRTFAEKINNIFYPRTMKYEKASWSFYISQMKSIIDDFKPDIIQVFGSEQRYGLIAKYTDIPVVIHLQGILSGCQYTFLPPSVSLHTFCFQDSNPKYIWSRYQIYQEWFREVGREHEILQNCKFFIGRTEWDKACISSLNSNFRYFYGSEILRSEFYEMHDRVIPSRLTITTTISSAIYKGFDIILNTAKILKEFYSIDFTWKVYGNVSPKFFENITGIQHERVNIDLCGVVNARQLKDSLSECTLYFHPSYIDNSPNSICEAQICGCPVVACHVGGVGSLVHHKQDGFLIPANDPFMGAYRIMQLYNDKELNGIMGGKAKNAALIRHDRKRIVDGLLDIYKEILKNK